MTNKEKKIKDLSSSIKNQRFVASGTQFPINNYTKMNEDQLKTLPYFQNYQKGIPSKVNIKITKSMQKLIFIFKISIFRYCM